MNQNFSPIYTKSSRIVLKRKKSARIDKFKLRKPQFIQVVVTDVQGDQIVRNHRQVGRDKHRLQQPENNGKRDPVGQVARRLIVLLQQVFFKTSVLMREDYQ